MKKKQWILLGGLTILAVIGFSVVSHAGRHFANPMAMGPMYRLNLLSEELGLTDDQRAALKSLVRSHRQEIRPLVKTLIAQRGSSRNSFLPKPRIRRRFARPQPTWAIRLPRRQSWVQCWRRRLNRS